MGTLQERAPLLGSLSRPGVAGMRGADRGKGDGVGANRGCAQARAAGRVRQQGRRRREAPCPAAELP